MSLQSLYYGIYFGLLVFFFIRGTTSKQHMITNYNVFSISLN